MTQWYEYTSGYKAKLQKNGYDISTLTFSGYKQHKYWKTLVGISPNWNAVNV